MASTMAKTSNSNTGNEKQSKRLQRRLPSLKIELASVSTWNVAIPLLSPLGSSPKILSFDQSDVPPPQNETKKPTEEEEKKSKPVFKKWQHPASPFCYDQATFVPPFISV